MRIDPRYACDGCGVSGAPPERYPLLSPSLWWVLRPASMSSGAAFDLCPECARVLHDALPAAIKAARAEALNRGGAG